MTSPVYQSKRPREDDVLECFLYPRFCYSLNPDQVTEDMLREEINKFNEDVEAYIKNYLWHRDTLTFQAKTKQFLQLESLAESSGVTGLFNLFFKLKKKKKKKRKNFKFEHF